jgi:hypothetical protein
LCFVQLSIRVFNRFRIYREAFRVFVRRFNDTLPIWA